MFVHDGMPDNGHLEYFIKVGFQVSDVRAGKAVETAITLQPHTS
jgi:hypothetical protein